MSLQKIHDIVIQSITNRQFYPPKQLPQFYVQDSGIKVYLQYHKPVDTEPGARQTHQPITIDEHNKDADTCIRQWQQNFASNFCIGKGFTLMGPVGVGKSLFMAHAFRFVQDNGIEVACINTMAAFKGVRESVHEFRQREYDEAKDRFYEVVSFEEYLQKVPVLMLDDIAKEHLTPWRFEVLYSLIECRSTNVKLTLFATNANAKELEKLLGPAIFSRLVEMAPLVKLLGPDRRRS